MGSQPRPEGTTGHPGSAHSARGAAACGGGGSVGGAALPPAGLDSRSRRQVGAQVRQQHRERGAAAAQQQRAGGSSLVWGAGAPPYLGHSALGSPLALAPCLSHSRPLPLNPAGPAATASLLHTSSACGSLPAPQSTHSPGRKPTEGANRALGSPVPLLVVELALPDGKVLARRLTRRRPALTGAQQPQPPAHGGGWAGRAGRALLAGQHR